ncbi:hypothetical protein [Acidaminobacterium chupaoyuni]
MAGNTIEELVNTMYEMVQDASGIPLMSDRCVIDREKALDILDEIRANIPSDLKMARDIVEKREAFLNSGKREAETIRKQAEELARQKVNENDLTIAARKHSAEIIATAEKRSKELMGAANAYCDDAMKRTEEAIAQALDEVKASRVNLRQVNRERQQQERSENQ